MWVCFYELVRVSVCKYRLGPGHAFTLEICILYNNRHRITRLSLGPDAIHPEKKTPQMEIYYSRHYKFLRGTKSTQIKHICASLQIIWG